MKPEELTPEKLKQGIQKLDELSQTDYRKPISEVIAEPNEEAAFNKVARLIGVSLKEPFAEPKLLSHPSPNSGAYRAWDLAADRLDDPNAKALWQYKTLEALTEEKPDGVTTVQALADSAHHERGFFGYLARSAAKYICKDQALRSEIEKSIKEGKAAGYDSKHMAPEILVQAGGFALATALIAHVPIFATVGAPVIAGFVIVLYTIGTDAFCQFVHDRENDPTTENAQKEK